MQSTTFSTIKPVFMKQKDIPEAEKSRPSVLEVCLAGERVAGQGSIVGAQEIRGLWRIYPASTTACNDLLVKGIRMRDTVLQVSNENPFLLKDGSGAEKPSTKVWVDNIPLSVADTEIEHALTKIGCELRSRIQHERARDQDHRLTRFLTGRRFLFITVPQSPLDSQLKVNIFTAKIFHKEQKLVKKTVKCSRCLQENHHVSECTNEMVCRECGGEGHKRGDAACQLERRSQSKKPAQEKQSTNTQQQKSPRGQQGNQAAHSTVSAKSGDRSQKGSNDDRSRPLHRQTSIVKALSKQDRKRSTTPSKRSRSREDNDSEWERQEKMTRRDSTDLLTTSDGDEEAEDTWK